MNEKEKFSLIHIAAVVLAALIIVTAAGTVFLFVSGYKKTAMGGETVELHPVSPEQDELTLKKSITVAGERSEEEDEEDEEEEKKEEKTEGYVIADSASRLLTDSDVSGLSAQQLNYAKNEIYARHGRKFDSPELRKYFESKSWYEGKYDAADFDANYSASVLSDVEKKNAEFLKNAENKAQSGGYKLDQ